MAKCKNCRRLYYSEVFFKHGTSIIPCCYLDNEEIENINEERVCYEFYCMTNADRIRSMTDEELADFIEMKQFFALARNGTDGEDYTLEWLKSEVGCEK